MMRRLLFLVGLAATVYGGWLVHREGAINVACNSNEISAKGGIIVSAQCVNIVWPYAEGFILLIGGAFLVLTALIWSRRAMAGERKYLRDVRAGKFSRENDHLNAHNFNLQKPPAATGVDWRRDGRGSGLDH